MPGAIHARRVKELLRHLLEELPHQKDAKCADETGEDDGKRIIDQAQIAHQQKYGNDRHLKWHHQGAKKKEKEQIAPGEAQAGEGVTGERTSHQADPGSPPP